MLSLFLPLSVLAVVAVGSPAINSTTVQTSTGYYTGVLNESVPNVRAFVSVPYGMSTAGSNRFMPPKPVPVSTDHFDATKYPPACPQYVTSVKNIWNQKIPQYLQYWGVSNLSSGVSAPFASEDCLKLAIWTPANATSVSKLPVAMFWTGGGYQTNGILTPGQLPQRWVSRSQSHVVVTINYRMNIMGFPNAAALSQQNLGLMDQRLSLEWVRDNIAAFGGDPSRIMIWGQFAGASSVDIHNYAFYEDPIAHAFFAESGSVAMSPPASYDIKHTNFTFVAKNVGCDFPKNATRELQYMQKKDYNDIINFMGQYQDNSTLVNSKQPAIKFNPVPDQKIVFANYTERYASGKVTKAPMIYSSVANEGGSLSTFPALDPSKGVNQTAANLVTERIMCGAAQSSILRNGIGLATYRYQYAGNWSNQDPLPWMGAYHSSDLVMLFGTYDNGEGPVKEALEATTSETMQDMLLAFVRDPVNGPLKAGWPRFNTSAPNGGTMLRFGADGKAVQKVDADIVQAVCFGKGTYNPFP